MRLLIVFIVIMTRFIVINSESEHGKTVNWLVLFKLAAPFPVC